MNPKHRVILFLFMLLFVLPAHSLPFEKSRMDMIRRIPRRFDCTSFCRTTGYEGVIGGCRCGYVLFVKKKSGQESADVEREKEQRVEQRAELPLGLAV